MESPDCFTHGQYGLLNRNFVFLRSRPGPWDQRVEQDRGEATSERQCRAEDTTAGERELRKSAGRQLLGLGRSSIDEGQRDR
jgi:hypothetical protein